MRPASVAAVLALAIAPAAHAAEAKVTATSELGVTVPRTASYAEPAQKITPVLTDSGASVTVRTGAVTVLQLAVAMPAAARLAPGTYDTTAGAAITVGPAPCVGLTGSFTLSHAIPGLAHAMPAELYLTATVRCGADLGTTTFKVRIARAKSRNNGNEVPKAFLPAID